MPPQRSHQSPNSDFMVMCSFIIFPSLGYPAAVWSFKRYFSLHLLAPALETKWYETQSPGRRSGGSLFVSPRKPLLCINTLLSFLILHPHMPPASSINPVVTSSSHAMPCHSTCASVRLSAMCRISVSPLCRSCMRRQLSDSDQLSAVVAWFGRRVHHHHLQQKAINDNPV
jgi:hypothetical protein